MDVMKIPEDPSILHDPSSTPLSPFRSISTIPADSGAGVGVGISVSAPELPEGGSTSTASAPHTRGDLVGIERRGMGLGGVTSGGVGWGVRVQSRLTGSAGHGGDVRGSTTGATIDKAYGTSGLAHEVDASPIGSDSDNGFGKHDQSRVTSAVINVSNVHAPDPVPVPVPEPIHNDQDHDALAELGRNVDIFMGAFLVSLALQETAMQRKSEIADLGHARRLCSAPRGIKACVQAGLYAVLHGSEVCRFSGRMVEHNRGGDDHAHTGVQMIKFDAESSSREFASTTYTPSTMLQSSGCQYFDAETVEDAKYFGKS